MTERDQVVEILRKAISPPFKAVMGRGDGIVVVDGRPGYIWCRKLGKTEMLMQAYNRGAPAIEDVIVLVQESRIEGVKGYEVIGVASSTSPGNYYPEVPPHAWTHEWRPGIGRDRVTVYPRAWGYLRAEPIATGSMNVWVTPGWYYYDDLIRWYAGGYSPGFGGTINQLLYFDPSDESLHLQDITGTVYGIKPPFIAAPPDCNYPIAMIESTGTFVSITENMIEDVRLFMDPIEDCGETGTTIIHSHQNDVGGGQLDHGLAHVPASLLGDDHAWYLKERASGGLGTEVPVHTHIAGQGGQLDWDNIWSDDIHDHSAAGEGGQVDVTDLTDSLGQLLTGPENTDLTDGGLTVLHQHAGGATANVLITLANRSGAQRVSGDVVVTDPNNDESFIGTAAEGYAGKVLVVAETIPSMATGTLWERGGPFTTKVVGVVSRNDGLRTSGTAYFAETAASPTGTGVFAIALTVQGEPAGTVKALFLDELGAPGGDGGVASHKDTHDPQTGIDPLDCGAPTTIVAADTAPAESASDEFARSEHVHGIDVGIPSNIGVANAEGVSEEFVRKDHVHDHPGLTIEPFDGHLNNPCARVYRNSVQVIGDSAWTPISFSHERFDTDAIWAIGDPTKLICKTAGKYQISASLKFIADNVGLRVADIRLNGVDQIAYEIKNATANQITFFFTTLWDMNVNDFIRLRVYQTSGGNLNVLSSAKYSPELMMVRVG